MTFKFLPSWRVYDFVIWMKNEEFSASSKCLQESSCLMSGRQNTQTTDRGISFSPRCFFALCWFSLTHSKVKWLSQDLRQNLLYIAAKKLFIGLPFEHAPMFGYCLTDGFWIHGMKIDNSVLSILQLLLSFPLSPRRHRHTFPTKVCVNLGSDPWPSGPLHHKAVHSGLCLWSCFCSRRSLCLWDMVIWAKGWPDQNF